MSHIKDMVGERYGRLVGIAFAGKNEKGWLLWRFRCDCGKGIVKNGGNIRQGLVISCGCANSTHFGFGTKTYECWTNMKSRVKAKAPNTQKYYGDIALDPNWAADFAVFRNDMGECPLGLTLDRIDNTKGYYKENCRWATRAQQSANTRRTHFVEVKGEKVCLKEACRIVGVGYRFAMKKLVQGLTAQQFVDRYI